MKKIMATLFAAAGLVVSQAHADTVSNQYGYIAYNGTNPEVGYNMQEDNLGARFSLGGNHLTDVGSFITANASLMLYPMPSEGAQMYLGAGANNTLLRDSRLKENSYHLTPEEGK